MSGLLGRILSRVRGNGVRGNDRRAQQAELALALLERIVAGAESLAQARERIAKGAAEGDLDDVISWARSRDRRVEDFIGGRDG